MFSQVDNVTQWDTHSNDEIALRLRCRQRSSGSVTVGSADHPKKRTRG